MRQRLIPIVRLETPYLALLQDTLRSPALDSYFAFTANLGTHTFFMIMLPILFWCGYTNIGRAYVKLVRIQALITDINSKDGSCTGFWGHLEWIYQGHAMSTPTIISPVTSDHDVWLHSAGVWISVDSLHQCCVGSCICHSDVANHNRDPPSDCSLGITNTFLLLCCLHRFRKTVLWYARLF